MPSAVVSGHQPTFMESTTTEGAPVTEGLPEEANAIENSRKNDRDRTRSTLATAYACTFQFPAKLGFQLIKLELYPLVHTYTANYVRVHFRHLGVYKESRVVHLAIRVRVS